METNSNTLIIEIPEGMEIDTENSSLAEGIVKFKQLLNETKQRFQKEFDEL